ncbi:hypothetical protein C3486_07635 [Streptomyces sp. Ru73]|uniref:DUF1707 and DUF4190 domain-containing protein n=1 Tax=Streptomyces sp. Ru73 TaxID=2080748 RepID=UPI000CDD2844|nr:DUF1707 and DUF4190 domain-containing protein [Streptomyces sp. Ru73]POX41806.1 hypothetical protein C3486_07635 [Streptomyces sp. Ru73]
MRASHADRERAVDVLKAGFAEGRLTQDEYEQRVARAYRAVTYTDLQLLVGDLPQGPVPLQPPMVLPPPAVPPTFLPLPEPQRTNPAATGAMICGLLTPLTWGVTAVPAVILGHKARTEIRRSGERGDGMALTGVVLGWLAIGGWCLVMLVTLLALLPKT